MEPAGVIGTGETERDAGATTGSAARASNDASVERSPSPERRDTDVSRDDGLDTDGAIRLADREEARRDSPAGAASGTEAGSAGDADEDRGGNADEEVANSGGDGAPSGPDEKATGTSSASDASEDGREPSESPEPAGTSEPSTESSDDGGADERPVAVESPEAREDEESSGVPEEGRSGAQSAEWKDLSVRSPCDRAEFERRFDALEAAFGRCARKTGAEGDVSMEFDLLDTGEKLRVEVWGSASDSAGSCVRRAVEEESLPAPESGLCFVRFTVVLEGGGGGGG